MYISIGMAITIAILITLALCHIAREKCHKRRERKNNLVTAMHSGRFELLSERFVFDLQKKLHEASNKPIPKVKVEPETLPEDPELTANTCTV